jgi:hypothetical protein
MSSAPFTATAVPTSQPLFCNPPLTAVLRETILFTEIASISAPLDLLTAGTPQNRAFEWLVDVDPAQVCPGDTLDVVQRYVLALLFYSTGGENWNECGGGDACPTVPYLSGLNVCLWYNTLCDGPNGNLIEIRLGTFNYNTEDSFLPIRYDFTHRSASVTFNRSPTDNNNLVGELPEELSAVATLQKLDFDNNGLLSGAIPATLGDLNQLEELDFGSNMFSGVIPEQLFSATNLIRIDLDNNNITGSIPSAVGNLQDLDTLQLDFNFLTGTLETRIGDLSLLSKCRRWRRLVLPVSQLLF